MASKCILALFPADTWKNVTNIFVAGLLLLLFLLQASPVFVVLSVVNHYVVLVGNMVKSFYLRVNV